MLDLRESDGTFNVLNAAGNGGVLASDTTPPVASINGDSDGAQRIIWANTDVTQLVFQVPCPAHFDSSKNLELYTRIASGSTTDAVGFTVESFFDEADTLISDTSATNQTATYANKLTTIGSADIPDAWSMLTVGLTPVAHGTDAMWMTGLWLEYSKTHPEVEFHKSDWYAGRIIIPYPHKLVSSFMLAHTIVTTGTVEAKLRQTDIGDPRGGAQVGVKLENADLTPDGSISNIATRYDFTLADTDTGVAPAFRQYFLILSATNAADRLGEPVLGIEVEKLVA